MKKIIQTAVLSCLLATSSVAQTSRYQDHDTQTLLHNIAAQADNGKVMFGVANGISRPYNNINAQQPLVGDTKSITGKDPQFVENDVMFGKNMPEFFAREILLTRQAQQKGIVIGYCWHLGGFSTNSFRYSEEEKDLAQKIIAETDSPEKQWYLSLLDTVVTPLFKQFGFPIIFRPFHEMNGGWFWWGSRAITPSQYITLYRITVDRLRANDLRNIIYCWSPDTYLKMEYYPGDDYVDIMGLDIYEPDCSPYHPDGTYAAEMKKLIDTAHSHNKIPAITETGLREHEGVMRYPDEIPDFWTKKVFSKILTGHAPHKSKANGIAYVMSWYNANWSNDNRGSLYVPYPGIENDHGSNGQKAIDDMKNLSRYKNVIFNGDSENLYRDHK